MTLQADTGARATPDPDIGSTPVIDLVQEGVGLATKHEYEAAAKVFRAALAIDDNNFHVLSNLGKVLCFTGEFVEAINLLEQAYSLDPDDDSVRKLLTKIYYERTFGSDINIDERMRLLRNNLAAKPDSVARIDMVNLVFMAKRMAVLADFGVKLDPGDLGQHVMIACMPKSGSSFLFQTLTKLTGWDSLQMSYAYMQNEEELYLPALRAVIRENTITQQHFRATVPNNQIIQAFNIRPIVLVRNLFDVVVSYTDFYDKGAIANTFFARRWERMDHSRKLDLIIDHFMPWYLAFFASWIDAMKSDQIDGFLVSYEQIIEDKPAAIFAISEFLGLEKSTDECAAAIEAAEGDKKKVRFNKGVAGRGEDSLDTDQKDRLKRLADYFDDIDFSMVGL